MSPERTEVRAAGGVVLRPGEDGPEVAIVHRPKYDDWSLPKGKLEAGEEWEGAALREVAEETGFRCELGAELTATRYRDPKGRPKRVRWWVMKPLDGAFSADDEVDEMRWVPARDAGGHLDYEADRALVSEALPLWGG